MNALFRIPLIFSPLIFASIILGLLVWTDPVGIGPGGVMIVLLCIYLECLSLVFVVLHFGLGWAGRIFRYRQSQGSNNTFSAKKAYYIGSVLAFIPVTLLAMQVFSGVQFTDVLLVLLFVSLATFYVIKRVPSS